MFPWFEHNREAILAGIVASLIALALQTLSQALASTLAYCLTFRLRMKRLLAFYKGSPVFVISGSMHEKLQSPAAVLMGPDATAASQICRIVEEVFPDLRVRHIFCSADQSLYIEENVVAVGGPVYNLCSQQIMQRLAPDVSFDDKDRLCAFGNVYEKSVAEGIDYGLIVRMPNAFAPRNRMWLVAGCGSHGVLAASHLVSRWRQFPDLVRRFRRVFGLLNWITNQDFVGVVRCRIVANDVADIRIVEVRRLPKN